MPTLDQISSRLQFAEFKKHDLRKVFEDLQSHSSSLASLTLQWEELQTHFDAVQSAIEQNFERLKSKEIQLLSLEIALDRRAKELELKEWELNRPIVPSRVKSESLEDGIDRSSSDANLRFCVTMDGRNLQLFLNENASNHGRMRNEVFAALLMSADPAKLVLDAMVGFYPPHLKNGEVEFEGAIVRRSCVLLLEQLARVGPPISPKVREAAARLAQEWKANMGLEVGNSLEILGFLWLLGAYRLTSEFDNSELLKLFENVVQHGQANGLAHTLGLTYRSAGSNILLSQVMTNQYPSDHLVKHGVAPTSVRPWPELKLLCINMDGKGLRSFLNEHVKEHDSMHSEVYSALQFAPDPAKLVLNILQVFYDPTSELNKGFNMSVVKKSCILLLRQLFRMSPPIKPNVKEAAMKLAVEWKEKILKKYEDPWKVLGFYLFLAVYGLASSFDPDELLGLLKNMYNWKKLRVTPDLCLALGLTDKIPQFIQDLIDRNLLRLAIRYIHVFELVDEFPPVPILKSYLNDSKWSVSKGEKNLHLSVDSIINKELAALRDVISCITEHNLESEFPLGNLEKRIEQLKKKVAGKRKLRGPRRKKAHKKRRQGFLPKSEPSQQSIPDSQLSKQNGPEPLPPQHSSHPQPQPSQQSIPESGLPTQNALKPRLPEERFLIPQPPRTSGPISQPSQQSALMPQPQPLQQSAFMPQPQPPQQSALTPQSQLQCQPPQQRAFNPRSQPQCQPPQQSPFKPQPQPQPQPQPREPWQSAFNHQPQPQPQSQPQPPQQSAFQHQPQPQPPQQSAFQPQPQLPQPTATNSQPLQFAATSQWPQQSIPIAPPAQQGGNTHPRTARLAEAGPRPYFGSPPAAQSIQWPPQQPVGYFMNQPAPYMNMSAGHYGAPYGPYGVPGMPMGSAHSIPAANMPYGQAGNPTGGLVATPNAVAHHYPGDALR